MDYKGPDGQRVKLTRAQRKAINRAAMLRTQVQELAAAGGVPLTVAEDRERRKNTAAALPLGRPVEFSDQEGEELCRWIAAGGSLRAWSRETGRDIMTVYSHLRRDALFLGRYALAHEDRADTLVDEMLEIADQSSINPSMESVQSAKLRVDTRKWIASKLRPVKWGDIQQVQHTGAVSIRIGIPQADRATNWVDATDPPLPLP